MPTWIGAVAAVGALDAALILLMRRQHLTGLILGCVLTLVGGLIPTSADWTTLDIHADAAPTSCVWSLTRSRIKDARPLSAHLAVRFGQEPVARPDHLAIERR